MSDISSYSVSLHNVRRMPVCSLLGSAIVWECTVSHHRLRSNQESGCVRRARLLVLRLILMSGSNLTVLLY